jgi:hypothetical protein
MALRDSLTRAPRLQEVFDLPTETQIVTTILGSLIDGAS